MLNKVIPFIVILLSLTGLSQTVVKIVPLYEGKKIELNRNYLKEDSGEINFSALRFYMSNIKIYSSKNKIEVKKIHLFDLEDTNSFILCETAVDLRAIDFLVGTDSSTNVSGILEGPLDPILGMYWTWNSGYINFKLEGMYRGFEQPLKQFEYHIGGYLPPFTTSRLVKMDLASTNKVIRIELQLDKWLKGIDLSSVPSVMIPGKQAAELADRLVPAFKIGYDQ